MILLTAHNAEYKECGDICVKSMQSYCSTHAGCDYVRMRIPDTFKRPPSWFKVGAILSALPFTDYVLWIDADAMIVGEQDFRRLVKPVTLNIARDDNGINNGVAAWKNCQQSFCVLREIDQMEEFFEHQWWEQAALSSIIQRVSVFEQPKKQWNAYKEDVCDSSQVVHFPGMPIDERLSNMVEFSSKL